MNRLSFDCPALRYSPLVALFLVLLAAFPGTALAQKASAPPAVKPTAPTPASAALPAAPPALTREQVLDGDARLDRLVTLDLISVPLGEVLQKESLDKSTDKMEDGHRFLLTAAPDCADLKLQIRLNNRPLRTLMRALAQMVPGTWIPTPHGYHLAMTRQAADTRTEWWRLFLGEREKAIARQHQLVLAAMQTKGYRRKDSDPDPEQSDRAIEADKADQHDFFHTLPPALKEQIAASIDMDGFYALGSTGLGSGGEKERTGTLGWLSQMSAGTQVEFKAALQHNVDRMAQYPPAYAGFAVKAQKDLTALDPSRVYFLFQNHGDRVSARPYNCPPSVGSEVTLDAPFWASHLNLLPMYLDTRVMVESVRRKELVPPEEWKTLIAYHTSRVWPNTLPKLPSEDGRYSSATPPLISRAAQTDWLGEQGHLEYVSDYYSKDGYVMPEDQKKLPVKRPLAAELDEMAARRDVSWVKSADGITLIRNNRWYRDDGLEVPQPLLRRWFAAVLQTRLQELARRKAAAPAVPPTVAHAAQVVPAVPQSPEERLAALKASWDWAAEVFGTLTPWQIYNGLAQFQPEEKDQVAQNIASTADLYSKSDPYVSHPPADTYGFSLMVPEVRRPPFYYALNTLTDFKHTAQWYGGLDDTQRTALLQGRLTVSALNPSQLAQVLSLEPLLPQAMQEFPPASVYLGLFPNLSASQRVVFGEFTQMRLDVSTVPQNVP